MKRLNTLVLVFLTCSFYSLNAQLTLETSCADAENNLETIVCGVIYTIGGVPGDGVDDPEIAGTCLDPNDVTWVSFEAPDVPSFEIDGSNFVLFEGDDCSDLTEIDCDAFSEVNPVDPNAIYWVAVTDGGDFEITTPLNEFFDCGNPFDIDAEDGPYNNCCSQTDAMVFVLPGDFDGAEVTFENLTMGGFTVDIYTGSCQGNLLESFDADFVATVPHCQEEYYIEVIADSPADCGDFELTYELVECGAPDPAMDACDDAYDLGLIATNGEVCVSSCNTFACDGECGGALNSVWFTFSTDIDASALLITVESDDGIFEVPLVTILEQDCGGNVLQGCADGEELESAATGDFTYMISVSSEVAGEFTLCIEPDQVDALCATGELEVSDRPETDGDPDGPFCGGEKVQFTYTVDFVIDPIGVGNNCQWLQGIIPTFGAGWDLEACPIEGQTNFSTGSWSWFDEGSVDYNVNSSNLDVVSAENDYFNTQLEWGGGSLAPGGVLPGGFWNPTGGTGPNCTNGSNPDTAWGLPGGCGGSYTIVWTFELQVKEEIDESACGDEDYLKVHIFTMADGQTGCWSSNACDGDEPATNFYEVDCDGRPEVTTELYHETCSSNSEFEIEMSTDGEVIIVEINEDSSGDVEGQTEGEYDSDDVIDDFLVNTSCSVETVFYDVYAIGENGCRGPTIIIEVVVFPEIEMDYPDDWPDEDKLCPNEMFVLEPKIECQEGDLEYEWDNGEDTESIELPHEGHDPFEIDQRICLTVTDENECTQKLCYEYFLPPDPMGEISGAEEVCVDGINDNEEYCLTLSSEVNENNYDIEWTFNPSTIVLAAGSSDDELCFVIDDEASAAGAYTFTVLVEDKDFECVFQYTYNVVIDSGPALAWLSPECNPDGSYTICGVNTNSAVTANLEISQNGSTLIGPLSIDTICTTITTITPPPVLSGSSSGGCTPQPLTHPVITPPSDPDLSAMPNEICDGEEATISVLNPQDFEIATITWTDGAMTWTGTSVDVMPAVTTIYTFSGQGTNGCTVTKSITVTVASNPEVGISGSTSFCPGESSELTAVGSGGTMPYDYTWSGNVVGSSNSVNNAGTYTVTVTDDKGCTATTAVEVTEEDQLMVQVTVPSFCEGDDVTLDGGAFDTYEWTDANGTVVGTSQEFTTAVPGNYTLAVTQGNCMGSGPVVLTATAPLPDAGIPPSVTVCNESGGSNPTTVDLGLLQMNGVTGTWTSDGGSAVSGLIDFDGATPGTIVYTFNPTPNSPCINVPYSMNIVIEDCACPSVAVGSIADLCANQASTINLGPVTITTEAGSWAFVGANSVPISNNSFVIDESAAAGTYSLVYTLTDPVADQCAQESVPVSFEVFPLLTATVVNGSACDTDITGDPTFVDLDDLVTGGNTSGSWTSEDPSATIDISTNVVEFLGLPTGSYTFTYELFDPLSECPPNEYDIAITVRDCNCPTLEFTAPFPDLCNSEGEIDLNDYLDSDDQGTWTVDPDVGQVTFDKFESDGIAAGTYTVTFAVDVPVAGCESELVTTIEVIETPLAILDPSEIDVCNGILDVQTDPFELDLTSFVSGAPGEWTAGADFIAAGGSITDLTAVNFLDIEEGTYVFEYVTNNAVDPCVNQSYPLEINVKACNCPTPDQATLDPLCDQIGFFDLDDLVTNLDELGEVIWALVPGGPDLVVDRGRVDISGQEGVATFSMQLQDAPNGCQSRFDFSIVIEQAYVADHVDTAAPCNEIKLDDTHCLDLDNYVFGVPGSWTDFGGFGGDVSDINNICFDGLDAGDSYIFTFVVDNSDNACADEPLMTFITVLDCGCPNLVVNDADDQCNTTTFDLSSLEDLNIVDGSWSVLDPNGNPVSVDGTDVDLNGAAAGTYELIYTPDVAPPQECDPTGLASLVLFESVNAGIGNAVQLCVNEPETIDLFGLIDDAGPNGDWTETSSVSSTGSGFDDTNGTFDTDGQRDGEYTFAYTIPANSACPESTAEVIITIEELPVADAGMEQTINCDQTADLGGDATSTGAEYSYSWSLNGDVLDAETAATTTVMTAGTYTLVVTNNDTGCSNSDEVIISSDDSTLSVDFDLINPDCGDALGVIILTTTGGDTNYSYSIDGGVTFQESPEFSDLAPGPYTISVVDGAGCPAIVEVDVLAPQDLEVDAGEDRTVDFGDELYTLDIIPFDFDIEAIESITWTNVTTGEVLCSSINCTSIEVDPDIFAEYCVTVIDTSGCEFEDCVELREKVVRDVYIPNTFDINNGDRANTTFHVHTDQFIESVNYIRIYDRWGELVFNVGLHQPNDPSFGWNGTWNNEGTSVEQGVYVYVLEIQYIDDGRGGPQSEIFAGDITILR